MATQVTRIPPPTIFALPTGVRVVGVYPRGVPNKEHVMLGVDAPLNLSSLVVSLGIRAHKPGFAVPIRDKAFFFTGHANAGDYVFLYTGSGSSSTFNLESGASGHAFYWGQSSTVFANPNIVPILLQIGSLVVGPSPIDSIVDSAQGS